MRLLNKIPHKNIFEKFKDYLHLSERVGFFIFTTGIAAAFLPSDSCAQWTNNTKNNTLVASGCNNPINIITAADAAGGSFIFWQDKTSNNNSEIFFQYVDEDGLTCFQSGGKKVTNFTGEKSTPVCSPYLKHSAVVVWKDFSKDKAGDLMMQGVSNQGDFLFGQTAMSITKLDGEELDPSVVSDALGNVFVSYIVADYSVPTNYSVCVQKVNSSGYPGFRENGLQIYKSASVKSHPLVCPDNLGGAYVFWVESADGIAQLYATHIDHLGLTTWKRSPVLLSSGKDNVFNYITIPAFSASAYIAWETKRYDKDIVHQLIGLDGRNRWRKNKETITQKFGNQTNPQAFFSDSSVTLSWINESMKDKDVYIQRFNYAGKPLWRKEGSPVIELKENQLSQKAISDRSGGAIVSWIDNRLKTAKGNIYAQRLDKDGNAQWDSTGIPLAAGDNTGKSYLSLLPNKINGAVIIFKENRNGINNIFAQRVQGNGKFIFDLLNFKASVEDEIVSLSWQTFNETNNKGFFVERTVQDSAWSKIKFVTGKNKHGYNYYSFSERPPYNGTINYRLRQVDFNNNSQITSPVKLDVFGAAYDNFALSQNLPNPFSDSTFIRYYLPERCHVKLEVYNDKIETITELVNEVQEKGEYSVCFSAVYDGAKLPGGVYFYRLKAGDFVDVKKMIISK